MTYFIVAGVVPEESDLPWKGKRFDAIVAIIDPSRLTDAVAKSLAAALVVLNLDWVDSLGVNSEHLHDLIDEASVACGRQDSVGDGSPMTAWHDDCVDLSSMMPLVQLGGTGGYGRKLVIVVGSHSDYANFVSTLLNHNRAD